MNLRQQTTQSESAGKETGKTAWYLQPDAPLAEVQAQAQSAPSPQSLFDPAAAERILARAGALQEIHGQMLSREQIEAIAAEIGIKPEFVQLAIEQESTVTSSEDVSASTHQARAVAVMKQMTPLNRLYNAVASVGAIVAYGILATLFLLMHHGPYPAPAMFLWFVFLLPMLLALTLGNAARSRRWGAGYGAMLGAVVVAALAASLSPDLDAGRLTAWDIQVLSVISASGALLGALGAQGRRVISRHAAKKRRGRAASAPGKPA